MDNRIITQLRACIDSLEGRVLFIGATNSLETLDLALRSRFYEVAIGIPNESARKKILQSVTADLKLEAGFDFDKLAHNTPSYVGRDFIGILSICSKRSRNNSFGTHETSRDALTFLRPWDSWRVL
jgi:ribosome biogenesis ATPase